MKKNRHILHYIWADSLSALLSWVLFFVYRKHCECHNWDFAWKSSFSDPKLYAGALLIAVAWLFLYSIFGYYRQAYTKRYFSDLEKTFSQTLTGVIVIFFTLILDDIIPYYRMYYSYFIVLFLLHFVLTFCFRVLVTRSIIRGIYKGKIRFRTLLIGQSEVARKAFDEVNRQTVSDSLQFVGSISTQSNEERVGDLPCLGNLNNLEKIIQAHEVQDVVIALPEEEVRSLSLIFSEIINCDIVIRITSNLESYLPQKSTSFLHSTLLLLSNNAIPTWQVFIKRILDIFFSLIASLILLPFLLIVALCIKKNSPGKIFYFQQRIGLRGKPFHIIKFRSMIENAEPNEPLLSNDNDERITGIGHFIRKYRIDELPQLFNVLRGDMSLVGPRPERAFFIEAITRKAPQYRLLLRVKPGLTSWGEVKYGYASTVDQMIERMNYDLMYVDNMSISNDIKILVLTVLTVLRGEGK